MKKILFIAHDDMSGGSSRSLLSQILILKLQHGVEPIVITWCENSLTKELRKDDIDVYPLRFDFTSVWTRNRLFHALKRPIYRLFFNKIAYSELRGKIDFSEISLLVSNSCVVDFGAYLYRKTGIPHVWYLREFGDIDFNILSYVGNLPRYISKNSTAIIGVSQAIADHWKQRGVSSEINVVYNGVQAEKIGCNHRDKDGRVRICMVGRLCPAKGQVTAIKAILMLSNELKKKVTLDFWGEGESEKEMRSIIDNLNLSNIISIKGFSGSIGKLLSQYDLGLNLSRAEGFGRTTVEYMMNEVYVIGCNTGATPELLQHGRFGTIVDVDAPGQVARAIEKFSLNLDCHKTIAEDAAVYAKENFSVFTNAENALNVYRKYWR